MKRTQLRFESLQQVSGGDGIAVILLTDMQRRRVLSVICDEAIAQQLTLRLKTPSVCPTMLPETLFRLLPSTYEVMIFGVYDGQYQTVLMGSDGSSARIRMSDAVLLHLLGEVPIYIEDSLMERQCVSYEENARGIGIPINTMDVERLKIALRKAVDDENYELASHLRDEINRRHERS